MFGRDFLACFRLAFSFAFKTLAPKFISNFDFHFELVSSRYQYLNQRKDSQQQEVNFDLKLFHVSRDKIY